MSIRTPVLVAVSLLLLTEGAARAQPPAPEDATAEEIAGGVVRNVRRSISLGPTFGLFSAYSPSAEELDGGLSFGFELELFKSGIPTPARVREIAKQKAKEKLAEIIRDRFAGQQPGPEVMEQLVREIAAQVKAEVLAAIGAKPRRLGRPRLIIPVEAGYFFGPSDWLGRVGFGLGFGPVALGPSFSVRFGDDTVARLGAELSAHLFLSKTPRSPMLDIFLRGDFELHARDANDDQVVLGIRALLDLI
jgi:hypothetical protein